jgi:hypothetical protein
MPTYLDIDDVKKHLRVDFDDDDAYIYDLVDMVEELVLKEIEGTVTGAGTVDVAATSGLIGTLTDFTNYTTGDTIKVTNETLRTIATITDDTHLTVSGAFVNSASGLNYVVHPGIPSPIPARLKHGMYLMVGHYYNNRESTIIGVGINKIPYGYEHLVFPDKNWTIA